jgi:hypothetical protein
VPGPSLLNYIVHPSGRVLLTGWEDSRKYEAIPSPDSKSGGQSWGPALGPWAQDWGRALRYSTLYEEKTPGTGQA